jgi:microcystin-dependent protein
MARRFILAPANPNLEPPIARRNFLSRLFAFAAGGAVLAPASRALAAPGSTTAAEPFVGEIAIVGFNFAPVGWALCNGQIMSIAQNTALFSLIGTYYGGNGVNTFALPNLIGRVPIHYGNAFSIGQVGGEEAHVLTAVEMPVHAHTLNADPANGTSDDPAGLAIARDPAGVPAFGANATTPMHGGAIGTAGANQPHNNMQPYLALNFIIALQGIYPSRS